MTGNKKQKDSSCNQNWEAEIAAYDEECKSHEEEFYRKHLIISEGGANALTEEENAVFTLFLNGLTCEDIAGKLNVEPGVVSGMIEVIRLKLSQ